MTAAAAAATPERLDTGDPDVFDVEARKQRPDEFLCPLCKLAEDRDDPCPGCPDYRNGAAS